MRGEVVGGIRISKSSNEEKMDSIKASIEFEVFKTPPYRMKEQLASNEEGTVKAGYTFDGKIYVEINGIHVETTIAEISAAVGGELDAFPEEGTP